MAEPKANGNAVAVLADKPVSIISDTFVPRNITELKELASFLASSDLIPKSLGGRKENVAIVLMLGHEIGVPGVAALTNIYVVNGRPTIWGDLATALVRRSPLCEELSYKFTGAGKTLKVIASGKRKGDKESHVVEYSWDDAVLAGNATKDTYLKNPKDMLMWRALHRLFKFLWPDVLKGLDIKEIVQDGAIEAEVVPSVEVEDAAPAKPEPAAKEAPAAVDPAVRGETTAAAPKDAPKAEPEAQKPAAEESLEEAPSRPGNVVTGILLGAFKLSDQTTGAPLGFAIKVKTDKGEEKYQMKSLEDAQEAKKYAGQTVELVIEPLEKAVVGVNGKVVELSVAA